MAKLKPEFKKKWLKALRRRKNAFKQGRNCLFNPHEDSYCCLGVVCEISGIPKADPAVDGPGYIFSGEKYNSKPNIHWAIANMFNGATYAQVSVVMGALVRLNDTERLSFRKIADWIEKNL